MNEDLPYKTLRFIKIIDYLIILIRPHINII